MMKHEIMNKYYSLLLWLFGLQAMGWLLGMLTRAGMSPWYEQLNRSALTPPGYIFAITWSLLYILLAVIGWLIWQQEGNMTSKRLFLFQLIFNWLWTPIFFTFHLIGAAVHCIVVIIVLTSILTVLNFFKRKLISWLLLPYLSWLMFACYLNYYIWLYN